MTRSNAALRLHPENAQLEALHDLLDRTSLAIAEGGPVESAVAELMRGLNEARSALGAQWSEAIELCRRHPLYEAFASDPITRRAREKPRGYAGDAVMIDYIYRGLPEAERAAISPLGAALFAATTAAPSAVAVRDRRDLLAERIDACAARVERPRVLSLACGHLREAALSSAVRAGAVGLLTAIDQDRESLAVIEAEHGGRPEIVPTHGSVADVLRGKIALADYDLVYAAGLYDYLPAPVATKLTRILFGALVPGGELVIGNFATDYATIGYTEAFMDWFLLCRSEEEVRSLAASIEPDEIASLETHTDATGCVAYLTMFRA